jgi:hypothetical protein
MKEYGEVDVQINIFYTSALIGVQQPASDIGRHASEDKTTIPTR